MYADLHITDLTLCFRRLSWQEVVMPAVEIARNGVNVTKEMGEEH